MASVFLLFMILFSFIVSCGVMLKDFKAGKTKKAAAKLADDILDDYEE